MASLPPEVLEFLQAQQDAVTSKGPYATVKDASPKTDSRAKVRGVSNADRVSRGGVFKEGAGSLAKKALGGAKGAKMLGKGAGIAGTAASVAMAYPELRDIMARGGSSDEAFDAIMAGVPGGKFSTELGRSLGQGVNSMLASSPNDKFVERPAAASRPNTMGLPPELGGVPTHLDGVRQFDPNARPTRQPSVEPAKARPGQAVAAPAPRAEAAPAYLPEELIELRGSPEVDSEQIKFIDPDMLVPARADEDEVVALAAEEVPPEMLVPAESAIPPEMEEVLVRDRPAPQVSEFEGSRGTLSALGQTRGKRPDPYVEKPKSFLRKTADFFRSGSRNPDLDKHMAQLAAYEADNKLTEREMLAAGFSEKDILSARELNHAANRDKFQDGMSSADKVRAQQIAVRDANDRARVDKKQDRDEDQKNALERIKAGSRAKSVAEMQMEFINDVLARNPDLDPEALRARGINPDPEALASIRRGRVSGGNPVLEALLASGAIRGLGGQATSTSAPDRTPASAKIKDKSMLNSSK